MFEWHGLKPGHKQPGNSRRESSFGYRGQFSEGYERDLCQRADYCPIFWRRIRGSTIKMMEFQGEDHLDTLVIMLGTNDVLSAPVTPKGKWEPLLICLLNELKEKYRTRLVVLCTIAQNPEVGTPVADFMNGNVTRWNEMTRSLARSNPSELRLMDL